MEEIVEEIEMRFYAKISFTQIDKDRKMEYAIWVEMNKSYAIVNEQLA